ncbi:MAG: sulfatase-like hydrolase/transferase [Betaproteobacteria bacterium]
MNHWRKRIGSHFKLTFYLCLLTAAAVGLFLKDAPAAHTSLPALYQWSVIGYYGTLLLLVALALLPLALFRLTYWLWPLLGWAWLVYLAIDIAVFNLYRFHLDILMVEMFLRDFQGMGIPLFVLALFALLAVALLVLVLWLFMSRRSGRRHHWPWFAAGLLLMPLVLVVNSVIHVWASHYLRDEITLYRPFLPIYYPVEAYASAPRLSAWWPAVFPAAYGKADNAPAQGGGIVQYPRAQPNCAPLADPPSILMIVLESWQADAMTADITPNIKRFAATATQFTQHVSSGAVTVPGLFGLMYGLHPNYFELTRSAPDSFPSLFTQTLDAQGYRTRVFTSTNLDGFSLKRMFFPKIAAADFIDSLPDAALVDRYIATLSSSEKQRFDFVFLTSSHSPYSYPPEYARFKPLPLVEGGYALDRHSDNKPYKNDYQNSLFFLDALVGKLLDAAEREGKLANTWVIITGDHAEEFNENGLGYWGHGSNFTRWQTHTPMIVRAPGVASGRVEQKMSLHQDVVPTLMQSALGCTADFADYSNGEHLQQLPESRGTVIASYMGSAYMIDGKVLERVVSRRYAWGDLKQPVESPIPSQVLRLKEEESRFLKR